MKETSPPALYQEDGGMADGSDSEQASQEMHDSRLKEMPEVSNAGPISSESAAAQTGQESGASSGSNRILANSFPHCRHLYLKKGMMVLVSAKVLLEHYA